MATLADLGPARVIDYLVAAWLASPSILGPVASQPASLPCRPSQLVVDSRTMDQGTKKLLQTLSPLTKSCALSSGRDPPSEPGQPARLD